ncbi:MAG: hypothetical protein IJ113_08950 [Eggerthellaceae bacterium]|nr:hypothetical protein [Eggerthellaceae bacterium]
MEEYRAQTPLQGLANYVRSIGFEECLFYFAFTLCTFTTLMMRTTYSTVAGFDKDSFEFLAYALVALLLLGKLILDRETSWRYALAWALVILAFVTYWFANQWRVSVLFLFIAAGKGVSLKRLAALALVIQATVLLVTVSFAMAGKLYSFTVWRETGEGWIPRLSYGYSHPNMLGQVFLTIALSFAVLRFPRFNLGDVLVYVVLAAAAGMLVMARTATAGIVLAGVLAALSPFVMRTPQRQHRMALLACIAFCFAAVFSYFMMLCYSPDVGLMASLDRVLSTRFSLAHRFFEVFPPQPFGRSIMAVKLGDFAQESPDNLYAYMLLKQGIVPTLVLGALVLAVYVRAIRTKAWSAALMGLMVFAIAGIMEMYAVNFTLDFFLIACAWLLYGTWPESRVDDA